jgi:hypothetical protein
MMPNCYLTCVYWNVTVLKDGIRRMVNNYKEEEDSLSAGA